MRYNILLLFLLLTIFSCTSSKRAAKKELPNIIYIFADDLGYGEIGPYGQQLIKTPNLDLMAAEGMKFTRHYASSPVCAPSRASLLTGLHQGHATIRGNKEFGGFEDSSERGQMPLPANAFTIADLVKNAGYKTAIIGKWGLGMADGPGNPNKHGFDYAYGYLDQKQGHNFYPTHLWQNGKKDNLDQPFIYVHQPIDSATATNGDFKKYIGREYSQDKFTEKALAFIQENKNDPFFLYLPYTIPHLSLQLPEKYLQPYIGTFPEKPYYGQWGYAPTKFPMATYAGMISYLDEQVGIIMKKLQELGMSDNTIVFFTSDNGTTFHRSVDASYFNLTAGLRGFKMDLYEGGIRVPLIVKWPGKIRKGSTSNHLSAQYDMMATLADITRQTKPPGDGISFLPALLNKKQPLHSFLYFEFSEKDGQVAIILQDWKGIKSNLKNNPNAKWELYNLKLDRSEKTNLAEQHPDILLQLDKIVQEQHRPSGVREWDFF